MLTVPSTRRMMWLSWFVEGSLPIGVHGSMVMRRRKAKPNSFAISFSFSPRGCKIHSCRMGTAPNLHAVTHWLTASKQQTFMKPQGQ